MKKFSPSKFMFFIMAFVSFICAEAWAASSQPARTVRDMMARRSGAASVQEPVAQKRVVKKKAAPVASKTTVASKAETSVSVPATEKDGSLFPGGSCVNCGDPDDKDGSLFPGGSCVSCQDPDDKDGSLFPGGKCTRCMKSGPLIDTGPCVTCRPKPKPKPVAPLIANKIIPYTPIIYNAVERNCCAMAPLTLQHVDFRLDADSPVLNNKLGNYRFRIFGCRRYDKEAILNRGRIMEKNMNFGKIFAEVTGDCYNLVDVPEDLCLQTTPSPLPEYVLTAEITDFFMNVCDGYDWERSQKSETRSGSAEITVTWKLSNLTKTQVLWEGETTGYSDVSLAAADGEIKLVEYAFADAVSNLRNMPGFEDQLMVRLTPEELSAQRNALIDEEAALNPAKCSFQQELFMVKQCEITRPGVNITLCPAMVPPMVQPMVEQFDIVDIPAPRVIVAPVEQPVITEQSGVVSDYTLFDNCIDEKGGVISGGNCTVVDDTWVDVQQDTKSFDSLCIVDRPPYPVLSPENLYKVRASVVEITAPNGKKGAGLIISDSFVLTSAGLVDKDNNRYQLKTINNKILSGRVVRVNPSKNTALVMLDQPTLYTPLSLNLDLPKVGQGGYMTLGLLDVEDFEDGENYIDNNGKVVGYRYSEDKGSEIMMDTFVQNVSIGGVLIDGHGTINGMAHLGKMTDSGVDLFLPTETALRSVGLTICEKLYDKSSPWQQTVYKPVTQKILTSAPKAPEVMKVQDRK